MNPKRQREKRFLLQLVSFVGTGCRTSARRPFDGAHWPVMREAFDLRQNKRKGPHIGRLLLYPDKFGRVLVTIHFGREFCFRERIELVYEDDSGRVVFALFPLGTEFVPDLSSAEEHASRGTCSWAS
jgi:hypothetical protein